MVPLDKAMTSFYTVNSNHVSICSGLTAILDAKLLSFACAELLHDCILGSRSSLYEQIWALFQNDLFYCTLYKDAPGGSIDDVSRVT